MKSQAPYVVIVVWAIVLVVGFAVMEQYSLTPGEMHEAALQWPQTDELQRIAGKPTLVMFAHPKCPCTRASIGELARLVTRCRDKATVYVVFPIYKGVGEDWEQTALMSQAEQIEGVQTVCDPQCQLCNLFHATSSGETFLYDSKGNLAYHGGITSSRGHAGDSAGQDAILSVLMQRGGRVSSHPVFGCSLVHLRPLDNESQ